MSCELSIVICDLPIANVICELSIVVCDLSIAPDAELMTRLFCNHVGVPGGGDVEKQFVS